MTHIVNWLAAVLLAAVFFTLLHVTAQPVDSSENRLQRAARALCAEEMGPGARVLWTRDGDLVCRPSVVTVGGVR